jgi:hypothetical protein
MSLIVLEGMDGSGKTTLGLGLYEELKLPFVKTISPVKQGLKEHVRFHFYLFHMAEEMDIVVDRLSLISHAVYGNALLGKNVLEEYSGYDRLIQKFLQTAPLIIYCNPPQLNLDSNPQMSGVKENAKDLMLRYHAIMSGLKCRAGLPVYMYDYTKPATKTDVLEAMRKHKEYPNRNELYSSIRYTDIRKVLHGE